MKWGQGAPKGAARKLKTWVRSAKDGAVGCGFGRERVLIRETETGAQEDKFPRGGGHSTMTFCLGCTFQSLPKLLKAG